MYSLDENVLTQAIPSEHSYLFLQSDTSGRTTNPLFSSHLISTQLYLPVLRDGVPHANLSCVTRSHQLASNEEKVVDRHTETEYTCSEGAEKGRSW